MEEESFEDEEIAEYINENYIAVKVDREERPDVDAIYMGAVQAITGRGGWPMTVWLTPGRKPFYGGTYFPARDGDRGTTVGFLTFLKKIKETYHLKQDLVAESGRQITEAIQKMLSPASGDHLPGPDVLHNAADHYKGRFDPVYGGVSGAPKFPSGLPVRLLFRYYRRTGEEKFLNMGVHTLEKMAAGGIYDQVGGGFHRYSVDEKWIVPHFEKMLYDNALLVMDYLEGYQLTGEESFRQTVAEILRYVDRDMTSSDGAFFAATDADSLTPDGHQDEGYFFTWTPEELETALGKERARVVKRYFSVGLVPNFEGRHILTSPESISNVARGLNMSEEELGEIIKESREILYSVRNQRPAPLRDEKTLTAWNGLMISAHARAGLILGDARYTDRAIRAAQFILNHLYVDNRLYRSYIDHRARYNAYLDDYAFFIAALLDLYEASQDVQWLQKAIELDKVLAKYYEDKENGGFFMTSNDHEKLIAREKPSYDGAMPSGNSVAVLNLMRLHEFTTMDSYRQRAENALTAFSGTMTSHPMALAEMLLVVDFYLDEPKEIILVSPEGKKADAEPFLNEFRKEYLPNRIIAVVTEGNDSGPLQDIIPLTRSKIAQNGNVTAYVCESGICKLPTDDPKEFARQIKAVKALPASSKNS